MAGSAEAVLILNVMAPDRVVVPALHTAVGVANLNAGPMRTGTGNAVQNPGVLNPIALKVPNLVIKMESIAANHREKEKRSEKPQGRKARVKRILMLLQK